MALIVFAHPGEGHCREILKEVNSVLDEKKIGYEVLDLYKMGFNPCMQVEEHYTSKKALVAEEIKDIQEKIRANDRIIFIYPTWWGSMPAMMKGFFDRVFTPGFAFRYVNRIPMKLLTGKKAIVFTTTGAPNILNFLGITNSALSSVKKDILGWCGIRAKILVFGNASKVEKNKEKISSFVKKSMSSF